MANIFSGHSYQLVTTGASYATAKSAAVDAGGYLVIINSQAENDFVYGLLSNAGITTTAADGGDAQYVWIGASDATTEGTWQWVDGTALSFSNWGSGYDSDGVYSTEPDNFTDSYVSPYGQNSAAMALESWPAGASFSIGQAGQWNDVADTNQLAYVIEISDPVNNAPTITSTLSASRGSVTEDIQTTATGLLTASDLDGDSLICKRPRKYT